MKNINKFSKIVGINIVFHDFILVLIKKLKLWTQQLLLFSLL